MDRGAWQATDHGGCKRITHDLVTKLQHNHSSICAKKQWSVVISIVLFPENHNAGDSAF